MPKIDSIVCPLCKSNKSKAFSPLRGYVLKECARCQFIWDPSPSKNILSQYNKSYFSNDQPKGGYANYFESIQINKKTFSDRINRITKKLGRKGYMLDVGCALGDSLMTAKNMGWKVMGLEVSKYASSATKRNKINVKNTTLRKSGVKQNTVDVITYQDVIEHIPDPLEECGAAYKLLKPGGMIYLVTPNIGGIWSKLLNGLWYHYKPGEHISYFNYESTRLLLQKSGFRDIKITRTYHVLSLDYIVNRLKYYNKSVFGFIQKLINILNIGKFTFRSYTGELEAWGIK